jgi:hypothetical protein
MLADASGTCRIASLLKLTPRSPNAEWNGLTAASVHGQAAGRAGRVDAVDGRGVTSKME